MTSAKGKAKHEKQRAKRPERPTVPLSAAIRMFLIGSIAILAAVYALVRHYSTPRAPMLVPAPASSEIPAPELDRTQ